MPSPADPPAGAKALAGLSRAEAGLVTLSAAIAGADGDAVAAAAVAAIRDGASSGEIYEAILQSYLFVGFPRAIEAFFAARPVLAGQGSNSQDSPRPDLLRWSDNGESLCRAVYGRNYEKLIETMRRLSPDLASWMILEGYGKTLSRPGLSPVSREYCVVAILTVTRMWRQLRSHAIGAVNVGGTRAGVREAIERCAAVAGSGTVAEALRAAALEVHDARG
jgi:4-carboxymuconolactone decarboxylase